MNIWKNSNEKQEREKILQMVLKAGIKRGRGKRYVFVCVPCVV